MSPKSSTLRSSRGSTHIRGDGESPTALEATIRAEWRHIGKADLPLSLVKYPNLLRHKSLLLNFAVEEFKSSNAQGNEVDIETFCERFQKFGHSLQHTIKRELEVQKYFDQHLALSEPLSTEWPLVGDTFGEFKIIEEIGRGAAAHVYLCTQPNLGDRLVVVKATVDIGVEATILGRLDHPSIIPIYSIGSVRDFGLHFICMPYCGRSTLLDVIACAFSDSYPRGDSSVIEAATRWSDLTEAVATDRGLPIGGTYVGAILKLASNIAEGLHYAHGRQILHGDVKPSNILVAPNGKPLILDFNLSKDFTRSLTTCGGTLAYMPPEYLRTISTRESSARPTDFNAAPDIYSFGAVLFELLTGEPRVQTARDLDLKDSCEALLASLKGPMPSVRNRNPLVSKNLESIVHRCIAFAPKDRFSDLREVISLLRNERRSVASVARFARVRPILSGFALGIPLIIGTAGSAYVASRPPLFETEYAAGLSQVDNRNLEGAFNSFRAAASANPEYIPAKFHLGLTSLKLGKYDDAIKYFSELAEKYDSVPSMEFIGYAFNLKGLSVAAIPWYERALAHGDVSVSVLNNLGASLINRPNQYEWGERLRRSDQYLHQANAIDPTCKTVHLNLVRLSIVRESVERSHRTLDAADHAVALIDEVETDEYVRDLLAKWCIIAGYDLSQLKLSDRRWRLVAETDQLVPERNAEALNSASPNSKNDVSRRCYLKPAADSVDPVTGR